MEGEKGRLRAIKVSEEEEEEEKKKIGFSLRKPVSTNSKRISLRSLIYSRNVSYIATLFHLVHHRVSRFNCAREARKGEGRGESRTLLESAGVHSLFPWRKNKEDLRGHPRGMVHLVCVINVSRTFTFIRQPS